MAPKRAPAEGPPRPLRAHMALCLLGFRGSGYAPAFVEAMAAVQSALASTPGQTVRLVDQPDRICEACPHLAATGCTLGGPGHEAHMRAHDREVLRRLDLEPGDVASWEALLARIGRNIRGADLDDICTTCPWLPLGVCRQSVDALGTSASAAASPGAASAPPGSAGEGD